MTNSKNLIDQLGSLRQQRDALDKRIDDLRGAIVEAFGLGEHEGSLYSANVFETETSRLDMTAVRAKLSASFIRAHSRVTKSTTVRTKLIEAKVAEIVAAA